MSQFGTSDSPEELAYFGKLSQHGRMTSQQSERIPQWTLGDRLRKARSLTGMTVRDFADHIGVSHGTVTSAETDARQVRAIVINAYAMATGVPREWLLTGVAPTDRPDPDAADLSGTCGYPALRRVA